jgi:hypothetical protein
MHQHVLKTELNVDHRNGNGLDNRLANLRPASVAQNGWNAALSKANTSGIKGVCWNKVHRKWVALIRIDGKRLHLGFFVTVQEAADAYASAAERYHGEFAKAKAD